MNINELFKLGMDRDLPELLHGPLYGREIDLGASGVKKTLPEALGYPEWIHPRDPIPAEDGSVARIHAFHFLEHLTGDHAILLLREIERVLMPGGVANLVMPYYNSQMQCQDLTHKSFWNEGTFANLFDNQHYDIAGKWNLYVHTQFIMGIVERNLALFVQLYKGH